MGILNLFYFMALLSVNIGFLNLLPIPVLDGGHLAFLAIEGITKHPLTMQQKAIAQQIGIFILLALMVVIFYNDIARLLGFIPTG
jgi:regulator of sigma E protease